MQKVCNTDTPPQKKSRVWCSRRTVANALEFDILVGGFELCCAIEFTFGKGMNLLIPQAVS